MRTFVILGIILILVSVVGAKWALDHQSPVATTGSTNGADANEPPNRVICWGYFDVEPGVAQLDPKQQGDIVEVAAENAPVQKGAVLLQIDDRQARLNVELAQADAKAAENQLAEARNLTKLYEYQKEQQKYAVSSIDSEVKELTRKRDRDLQLQSSNVNDALKKTIREMYQFGLDQLADKKKSEEAKAKQLGLLDAKLKIDHAQADLDAKNVRVKQAKEMLNFYKIVAPSDGTVLRVHVHKGETLGPNPMKHAVEFLPAGDIVVRAEVMQEWGRFIKVGLPVEIVDDTYHGPKWKGEIKSISKWYAPTRSPVIEPLRYNDVRTLECIIKVTDAGSDPSLIKIGQRVRAKVAIK